MPIRLMLEQANAKHTNVEINPQLNLMVYLKEPINCFNVISDDLGNVIIYVPSNAISGVSQYNTSPNVDAINKINKVEDDYTERYNKRKKL